MNAPRLCSRVSCSLPASATLTYVYVESTVVLGTLTEFAEPHTYDLCHRHAENITVPRGWQVVRLGTTVQPANPQLRDDLSALADALDVSPTTLAAQVYPGDVVSSASMGGMGNWPTAGEGASSVAPSGMRGGGVNYLRALPPLVDETDSFDPASADDLPHRHDR